MTTTSPRPSPPMARLRAWVLRCDGEKSWAARAVVTLAFLWIFWHHLRDRWYSSIFDGMNLAFHEIGHVLFGFLGNEFITVAGGTILELTIPLVAAGILFRQGDAYGVGVAVFWFGTALQSVGQYIADTRSQIFPRVSIGPATGPDDWTYLLSHFDLIRHDVTIGTGVQRVGLVVLAVALVYSAWVVWLIASSPPPPEPALDEEEVRFAAWLKEREG